MLRGLTNQRLTAMPTIELRGDRLAGAATLRSTLADLLDRLYARDGALDASRLKALVVTDDVAVPAQGQAEAPPLVREDHADGCTIRKSVV